MARIVHLQWTDESSILSGSTISSYRQAAKSPPSQGGVTGSNPVASTIRAYSSAGQSSTLLRWLSWVRIPVGPPKSLQHKSYVILWNSYDMFKSTPAEFLFTQWLLGRCVVVLNIQQYNPTRNYTTELNTRWFFFNKIVDANSNYLNRLLLVRIQVHGLP